MLHRDVKPSNVLIARQDHVYLSDFGLAKRAEAVGGLTRQGSIIARAEYVAPEQILGERVDARSDIYALGCLLFETLTGEPPFARWREGPEALAHLNAPLPSPVELCPEVPPEFDDVVRRAMAKDPSERYASAGDLGQAALAAAGGLRQASPRSVVDTGRSGSTSAAEGRGSAREGGGRESGERRGGRARCRGPARRGGRGQAGTSRGASLGVRTRHAGDRGHRHGRRATRHLNPSLRRCDGISWWSWRVTGRGWRCPPATIVLVVREGGRAAPGASRRRQNAR